MARKHIYGLELMQPLSQLEYLILSAGQLVVLEITDPIKRTYTPRHSNTSLRSIWKGGEMILDGSLFDQDKAANIKDDESHRMLLDKFKALYDKLGELLVEVGIERHKMLI